jgi:hypothetical protein
MQHAAEPGLGGVIANEVKQSLYVLVDYFVAKPLLVMTGG